jgi:predicted peptidase
MLSVGIAGTLMQFLPAYGDDKAVPEQQGSQQAQHFEREITVTVKLNYLLYVPPEYRLEQKEWPLLVFLHGSGERGNDLNLVKKHGPPKLIEEGKQFPFIVVSPQAPRRGWDPDSLNALLDDLLAKYHVDKNRVYLTGLSMGGSGTWSLAAAHPEKFAAIVPICGAGDPEEAEKLKAIPTWIFHGAKDSDVSVRRFDEMVKALKDAGAKSLGFTLYPDTEHDSWTKTYENPELYEWLLKHSRAK